jgi:hypothetical protein
MTNDNSWLDGLTQIAKDFEHAEVRQLLYKRIDGKVSCMVVVRNADGGLITWELVDDDVSSDRWRKVSTLVSSN